jgi:hypothetical protein
VVPGAAARTLAKLSRATYRPPEVSMPGAALAQLIYGFPGPAATPD